MLPPSVIPASAPPRVRDRLASAPDGPVPVVHRGRHAVYVDVAGWAVGVVGSDAAAVPCALRVATPDLGVLTGASAHLRGGVLHVDGTPLAVGRIVDVRVPGPGRTAPQTAPGPATKAIPPAAVAGLVASVDLPPRLDPAAVARLLGRGDGLTPLGDDLLCGWLAMHRAAGVATPAVDAAVRALLPRTTLLSGTLLDCALHGEVLPEFAAFVAALDTPREGAAAAALAAVGHTSGAGLLHGARLALSELHDPIGAAA